MKTIQISENTHSRLRDIKYKRIAKEDEYENLNFDELINRLATEAGY